MREINVTAHRVIQTAERVKQSAVSLVADYNDLWATSGRSGSPALTAPVQIRAEKRCESAIEKSASAQAVIDADLTQKSEEGLAAELRRLEAHLVQLETLKDEIDAEQARVKDDVRTTREALASSGGRVPPRLR